MPPKLMDDECFKLMINAWKNLKFPEEDHGSVASRFGHHSWSPITVRQEAMVKLDIAEEDDVKNEALAGNEAFLTAKPAATGVETIKACRKSV